MADKPRDKNGAGSKKRKYLRPLLIAHGSLVLAASKAWGVKPAGPVI